MTTLHGTYRVTIPPGTNPGEQKRLPNKGLKLNQKIGDHFVNIQVMLPKVETEEERELIK